MLENGADLHVNKCQKIRHYCARSTEGRRRKKKNAKSRFFTSRGAYVNLRYIAMLYTYSIGISRRTLWWYLKCVMLYLVRDIPAVVMYCVNGKSGSSILIVSTDSMIYIITLPVHVSNNNCSGAMATIIYACIILTISLW